jgi:DNA polymerase III psi subunit
MSLNDIKMHPRQIADLYPDSLVETALISGTPVQTYAEPVLQPQNVAEAQPVIVEKQVKQAAEAEKTIHFLGAHKKRILILVAHEKAAFLPEHELKFLTSVLKACQFAIDDVAILNLKKQPGDHVSLQSFFQSTSVLLFGIGPLDIDLPMNFPQFQLQNFNKCIYLHAPALNEIEKEKELKQKLWSCLKNLFSL